MKHLTVDEIKGLLRELPSEKHRLLVMMGFLHGLRVSELLAIKKEDLADKHIYVQRLKGSLPTVQPWIKHPDPELDEYTILSKVYSTMLTQHKLFLWTRNGVYKMIQKAGKKAGISARKLHPHILKHSCAMLHIKTSSIEDVRQYLGHKSIASTGAYLIVDDDKASESFMKALLSNQSA